MDIQVNKNTVIVFDLDDTLYKELDYLISAYKEIAKKIDKNNKKQLFSIMLSLYRNNKNVFEYLKENYKIDKNVLLEIYRNHQPKIKLNKGIKKIFKLIKSKQGKIVILTDGRTITQKNKIKALKISKFIDYASISEEVEAEKPSEIPFKLVMSKLPAQTYFYIGDNFKKDFIAPNELKWKTIGIIDNGKNIHSNSYLYQEAKNIPHNLVYNIAQINIK